MADPTPTVSSSTPTSIEARLIRIEQALKTDATGAWGFVKKNWAHFITWAGVAYSIWKHL